MVNTHSATEAFTIRQSLHHHWQELFLSACEAAFDEVSDGDSIIHIPKLELCVNVASEAELTKRLPELIQQQLHEQLQRLDQLEQAQEWIGGDRPLLEWQQIPAQRHEVDLLLHYLQTGSVVWQMTAAPPAEIAVTLRQSCHQHSAQLLDYLHHTSESAAFYFRLLQLLPQSDWLLLIQSLCATLPTDWSMVVEQILTVTLTVGQTWFTPYQQQQVIAEFLADRSQSIGTRTLPTGMVLLNQLLFQTSQSSQFYLELLQSIPQTDWLPLVNTLCQRRPFAWETTVIQVMTRILSSEPPQINLQQQQQLIAAFLAESLQYPATQRPPDVRVILERILGVAADSLIQALALALPTSTAVLFPSQRPGDRPQSAISSQSPETSESDEEPLEAVDEGRSLSDSQPISSPISSYAAAEDRADSSQGDPTIDPEVVEADWQGVGAIAPSSPPSRPEFPLSVRYAGLVLLHPFIPHFLTAVGVKASDEKTILPENHARAAALLHFLATGTTEIYEYELDLIKVFLGMTPDEPLLVAEGLIQAADQAEATTLLESVIQYWSVLKNTSITGLRSSFLQRPGLLRHTEEGWRLQVEPQAFDLLLNHLPWTISIVKFTWMPQPIYTEWLTP
jgi:hypothetical protein